MRFSRRQDANAPEEDPGIRHSPETAPSDKHHTDRQPADREEPDDGGHNSGEESMVGEEKEAVDNEAPETGEEPEPDVAELRFVATDTDASVLSEVRLEHHPHPGKPHERFHIRDALQGTSVFRRFRSWLGVPAADPPTALVEEPVDIPPHLVDYLSRLGASLSAANETVTRTQEILQEVAAAYDVPDARFFVLPTGVFTRVTKGSIADLDFASVRGRTMRLDQVSQLYDLIARTIRDKPKPRDALIALNKIYYQRPRFSLMPTMCGRILVAVGLAMTLRLTWHGVLWAAVIGLGVALVSEALGRYRNLSLALPVLVATGATIASEALGVSGLVIDDPLNLVIPAVVAFLPGAALTIGAVELAVGEMVSGSTRLIYGINVLVLLAFGCFVGVIVSREWFGTMTWSGDEPFQGGPAWIGLIGVLVFVIGQYLFTSAPKGSFVWILLAVYVVWAAQTFASLLATNQLLSSVLGAFFGGLAIIPVAAFIARQKHGPPAQVTYLPAFWLLVPGTVGFQGFTELINSQSAGLESILRMVLSIVAIALGVLVSSSIFAKSRRIDW